MKNLLSARIIFVTPCFCAGADQRIAEVRAPAIRGELRWWFRCLKGSRDQEQHAFGGIGDGTPVASSLLVRVSDFKRSNALYSPGFIAPGDSEAYHNYLLTAPNDQGHTRMWETPPNDKTKKKGIARSDSQIPQESSFVLSIYQVRDLPSDVSCKVELAIRAMLAFGGIGYRMTRGFGAWRSEGELLTKADLENLLKELSPYGFSWRLAANNNSDPMQVFRQIEGQLKGDKLKNTGMRLKHPANSRTPLGFSLGAGSRQASAIHFRPCAFKTKTGEIQFTLLTFQAPDSVLGSEVKDAFPAGTTRLL